MVAIPRLVIAAPASGCGKTTVACGLMAALRARDLAVSGHKVGPDYIDPGYHALATGRPPRNLDPFLCGEDQIAPLFRHGADGAQIAVVEGVMGLFDGVDPALGLDPDFGSTAHVARLLGAPVILVVDAARAGRSAAALVAGFAGFDPRTPVDGVILNRVASDRHERLLREAFAGSGMAIYGVIRRTEGIVTPSRHLGLIPVAERETVAAQAIGRMAALIAGSCDLDALVALARRAPVLAAPPWDPGSPPWDPGSPPRDPGSPPWDPGSPPWDPGSPPRDPRDPPRDSEDLPRDSEDLPRDSGDPPRDSEDLPRDSEDLPRDSGDPTREPDSARPAPVIAVAAGEAFTFGYTEQTELLEAAGARVAPFDPLRDEDLPEGTAGLILGGGFPEMHAAGLSVNERLRGRVAALVGRGAPVTAECAGLLYLGRTLDERPMCGVLDVHATMTPKLTLGYRCAVAVTDSVLARAGEVVRGHEFHRTAAVPAHGDRPAWRFGSGELEGHVTWSCVASYLHTHWAGQPAAAARFTAAARAAAGVAA